MILINKLTIIIFLIVLLPLFLLTCGTENKPTYTLTTSVSPDGVGVISPTGGEFSEGETVTVSAKPTDGWRFARWEGDWNSTLNPASIPVDKNYTVIGIFERNEFLLDILVEGEGTVTENMISQPTQDYTYETVVELTPEPSSGWRFAEWGGDASGSDIPLQVTINQETSITATFVRVEFPLNITIEGEGTVTENVISQPSQDYAYEAVVELIPEPSSGWRFAGWGGDASGSDIPLQVTINQQTSITATFFATFSVAENGITIQCPLSNPGDIGIIDGIEYEAVDRTLLYQRRNEGADLSKVCTSLVTDMSGLFSNYTTFNQDITSWDVSNVTNMRDMFKGADLFDQPIGVWDVSSVQIMSGMFHANYRSSVFNQDLNDWDVSSVILMDWMFHGSQFNRNIQDWNVSNVTNMSGMFRGSQFNRDIQNWNVSNVTNMSYMFSDSQFNRDIQNWNVSNVTNMSWMFHSSQFNQPISGWDVSNVSNMFRLFSESVFNQPIGSWDVSNVTNMDAMFTRSPFNQPINNWCVINIPNEPNEFSSVLAEENKPIWGTCPSE